MLLFDILFGEQVASIGSVRQNIDMTSLSAFFYGVPFFRHSDVVLFVVYSCQSRHLWVNRICGRIMGFFSCSRIWG